MLRAERNTPDAILTACSVLYVLLPVIIFFFGWLKFYIAAPVSLVFIIFAYSLYSELSPGNSELITKDSSKFWLCVLICLCVWVLLSGIGGVFTQNTDFLVRNSIYRDLCNYNWPVIYDMSTQEQVVQEFMGSGKAALSYYFGWWLVPALAVKIFSLGQLGQDICIYTWALIGCFLTVYNLCRYFRKNSFLILVILIFFSGLDIIGAVIMRTFSSYSQNWGILGFFYRHLEWWAGFGQYSANTSTLFWVFNQSIPVWVIISLFLQLYDSKNQLALCSLSFAYSAWAAIGIIPIAFASIFIRNKTLSKSFSLQNYIIPLSMVIIYGMFYLASSGSHDQTGGFILTSKNRIAVYFLFIFLEFGLYFILMGKQAAKFDFYYIILAELILIPSYKLISSDFIMRASIPPLFMLMTFLMKCLVDDASLLKGTRRALLIAVMIIGAWTPMNEINGHIIRTGLAVSNSYDLFSVPSDLKFRTIRRDEIYSFGNMRTDNENALNIMRTWKNNFFAHDYEDSAFFKYLAK